MFTGLTDADCAHLKGKAPAAPVFTKEGLQSHMDPSQFQIHWYFYCNIDNLKKVWAWEMQIEMKTKQKKEVSQEKQMF